MMDFPPIFFLTYLFIVFFGMVFSQYESDIILTNKQVVGGRCFCLFFYVCILCGEAYMRIRCL